MHSSQKSEEKAASMKLYYVVFLSFFLFSSATSKPPPPKFSAIYAFGDSTLDPGNNDVLTQTNDRSDHPPYGLNFPGQVASGRFTDGKLATDFLVSDFGIKDLLPAYLDPRNSIDDLLTGVSFASAGSGLDDLTPLQSGTMTLLTQLQNFQQVEDEIRWQVGNKGLSEVLDNALFVIGAGTNDVLDFYAQPRPGFSSISDYHDFLLGQLNSLLENLHQMGARKFAVTGLPPVGCLPIQLQRFGYRFGRPCLVKENEDSEDYNRKLQGFMSYLKDNVEGSKFVYLDIYTPIMDMIEHPKKYGFERVLVGCCPGLGPMCNDREPICEDPSKFLFWDAIHPSQAAYKVVADSLEKVLKQTL